VIPWVQGPLESLVPPVASAGIHAFRSRHVPHRPPLRSSPPLHMSLQVRHERVPVSRTFHSNLSVTFPHSERSFQVQRRAQFAVVIAACATRLEKAILNYAKRRWIAAGHHCRGSGTGAPWRRLVALFEAKARPNHAHDLTAIGGFAPGTIFASNCVAQHADVPSPGERRSRSSRR
jgi:hypothetical protein